tara:strand:- start:9441 stop:10139 length:699 start_codon:yes stop_codon:yes gene_type:complete
MSSRKRRKLGKLFYESNSLAGLLFEQEEDLFADEPEEDTEGEEAEGGDEGADEEGAEGADEEGAEGEEAEGEEAEEEDEKLDVDLEDEVKLSKSIDQDLEALLIDFETDARKSKEIDDTALDTVEESLHLGMLLEQDDYEAEIDLDRFTAEVARLVKNYTSLLDMEKMLVSKAREFVATRYGEKAEQDLVDTLSAKHDVDIVDSPAEAEDSAKDTTPIAVGAGTGAAGGSAA